MDREQPAELLERSFVVVDAEVDQDVGEPRVALLRADDEKTGRLLPAAVATGRLRRVEAVEKALGKGPAGCRLECLGERVDGLGRDEDVPLRRVPRARSAARPVAAAVARVRRGAPLAVDDAELSLGAAVVRLGQLPDDVLGRRSRTQQRETVGPVARVRPGLGRDRADERLRPGDDAADGEELRLDGDPPVTRSEVAGADRVGRDRPSRRSSPQGRG